MADVFYIVRENSASGELRILGWSEDKARAESIGRALSSAGEVEIIPDDDIDAKIQESARHYVKR